MKGSVSIFLMALAVALTGMILAGCKSTHDPKDGPQDGTSNLPWTRPASWEGNPMGGALQGTR
ncbi:MAG: hypothetical protein AAF591_19470 [Verrucomicrobiota bacterium]